VSDSISGRGAGSGAPTPRRVGSLRQAWQPMFERFTAPARQTVQLADEEARLLGHDHIGTEHLLLGLLRAQDGVAAGVLADLGITPGRAREAIRIVPSHAEATSDRHRFSPRAKMALELALRERLPFKDPYITTAHLLLALTRVSQGAAARVMFDLGVDPEQVGGELLRLRSAAGGGWHERAWEEPLAPGSTPGEPWPLRATAVRAVVEVALYAAAANARQEDRVVDLGDLLLALVEGWPQDLFANPLARLGVDRARLREAVEAARRRGE
jgi:Clp amino terminal domain, pathogenicity island component